MPPKDFGKAMVWGLKTDRPNTAFSNRMTQKHSDMKILIVDDEEELGRLLRRFLGSAFEVSAVLDLGSAERALKEGAPDVMILDNNLPDGSGIESIPHFLSLAPPMKVIVISAMSHLSERAMANGAIAFLEKPLSLSMLKEKVLCVEREYGIERATH